jgi:hypothetical protein
VLPVIRPQSRIGTLRCGAKPREIVFLPFGVGERAVRVDGFADRAKVFGVIGDRQKNETGKTEESCKTKSHRSVTFFFDEPGGGRALIMLRNLAR